MTDESRLEPMLGSLAHSVDWPTSSPHLPKRVAARIEGESTRSGRNPWRRLAIAMVAVLVVTGLMVFSPSARQAMADLFEAAGIRIGFTSDPAPTAGAGLNLGEPVDLDDVGRLVNFEVRIPAGEDPGPPDGVYLSEAGQLTMVWVGSRALPAAVESDIALLLTQGQGLEVEDVGEKTVSPGTVVRDVTVEGARALWIEGGPHTLTLVDADGNRVEETTRLAANVLLWDAYGVNHRLETTGDLQSALAIVETLEGVP